MFQNYLPSFNWQLGYSVIERSDVDFYIYMGYKLSHSACLYLCKSNEFFLLTVVLYVTVTSMNSQENKKCELSHKPFRQAVMV